jgi:hypothetical protein
LTGGMNSAVIGAGNIGGTLARRWAAPSSEQLISDVGLRSVWLAGTDTAGLVDQVLRIWFALVFEQGPSRCLALNAWRSKW